MCDDENNRANSGKGWTDRQRLAYFFSLVEFSKAKLDYVNAPRPEGKSVGACQIMVHRLKGTLKDDLAVLKGGERAEEDTPKKPATPRKRKTKGEGEETSATPTKRGRKKKEDVQAEDQGEDDKILVVKAEPHDEESWIEAET
ncbi:hypothetical protein BKA66DRAFT_607628 [Pyrenochaeta sp. MPI-SDFR-AT-0127]|nr:hypothetical protein BKA66DRAFT_607628 [Pyrenochaeta sp. MPI-SDFR-AT-0127]